MLSQISRETFVTAFASQNNPKDFKHYINKAFSMDTINSELNNIASHFYFAYYKNNLIGYFKLNEFDAQNELQEAQGIELERIYVINKFQGKGLGGQILQNIFKLAIKKEKLYIWLGVWELNKEAIRFYQEKGFIKFGTHPYYIGNDKQTDWLMRKEL